MIVGVDHIALSCDGLDDGIRAMASIGFETTFVERDAPNRDAKRSFLRTHHPTHSLAMCRSSAGLAIELTAHGTPEGQAPFQLLFEGVPALPCAAAHADAGALEAALGVRSPAEVHFGAFRATALVDQAAPGPAVIRAILLAVRDLERSRRFWCDGIGGRVTKDGNDGGRWALVEIPSPLPRCRLTVLLTERAHDASPNLDACGFPCLALLATNMAGDRQRLLDAGGHDPSADFSLPVNGKPLVISLLRGPDMEIIELIQPSRELPS